MESELGQHWGNGCAHETEKKVGIFCLFVLFVCFWFCFCFLFPVLYNILSIISVWKENISMKYFFWLECWPDGITPVVEYCPSQLVQYFWQYWNTLSFTQSFLGSWFWFTHAMPCWVQNSSYLMKKRNPITISFIIFVIQLLIYLGKVFQESHAPGNPGPSCSKILIPHVFFWLYILPLSDSSKRLLQ